MCMLIQVLCIFWNKNLITHDKINLATCSQDVTFADYASNNLTSIFIFNQNSSPLMSGGDLVVWILSHGTWITHITNQK